MSTPRLPAPRELRTQTAGVSVPTAPRGTTPRQKQRAAAPRLAKSAASGAASAWQAGGASPYGKPRLPTPRRAGPPEGAARVQPKAAPAPAADEDGRSALANIKSQQADVADRKEALDRRLRLLDRMETDSVAQLSSSRRIALEITQLKNALAADPPPKGHARKEMEQSLMQLCAQARALIAVDAVPA